MSYILWSWKYLINKSFCQSFNSFYRLKASRNTFWTKSARFSFFVNCVQFYLVYNFWFLSEVNIFYDSLGNVTVLWSVFCRMRAPVNFLLIFKGINLFASYWSEHALIPYFPMIKALFLFQFIDALYVRNVSFMLFFFLYLLFQFIFFFFLFHLFILILVFRFFFNMRLLKRYISCNRWFTISWKHRSSFSWFLCKWSDTKFHFILFIIIKKDL